VRESSISSSFRSSSFITPTSSTFLPSYPSLYPLYHSNRVPGVLQRCDEGGESEKNLGVRGLRPRCPSDPSSDRDSPGSVRISSWHTCASTVVHYTPNYRFIYISVYRTRNYKLVGVWRTFRDWCTVGSVGGGSSGHWLWQWLSRDERISRCATGSGPSLHWINTGSEFFRSHDLDLK
jgi:hypothetical protein